MRSSWGQYVHALRRREKMSQTDFAKVIGESVSRISNLEYQRTNIGADVVKRYQDVLARTDAERTKIQTLAEFSNANRRFSGKNPSHGRLQALLEEFGDRISSESADRIMKIIDGDIGREVKKKTGFEPKALTLATNQMGKRKKVNTPRSRKKDGPASVTPQSFFAIAMEAEEHRRRYCMNSQRLDIVEFLESTELEGAGFCLDVVQEMPRFLRGAFACIVGGPKGNAIIVAERFFNWAVKGKGYSRHVLAHEYGHHVLHSHLLETNETAYLPPQELSFLDQDAHETSGTVREVIDTVIEAEAECFATLLLVPWTELLSGKEAYYLARDFGEDQQKIQKYLDFLKLKYVRVRFEQEFQRRIEGI